MTESTPARRPPGVVVFVFGRFAEYVWELRLLFLLCLLLFFFSLAMGFYLGDSIPVDVVEEVMGALPDVEDLSLPMLFLLIFFNNLLKSFFWMVLGTLFSAPALFFIILNGFLIGLFSYNIELERGLTFTLFALIPHGVIEIPAILLSSAAGVGLGYHMINRLRGRGSLKAELGKALRLFFWRIAPLLLLAAVVEVIVILVEVYLIS